MEVNNKRKNESNNDYIKTPLNYTGNKYRILPQIFKHFPKGINVMVDLFCGGATVGINANCKKAYMVDNNIRVIELLKYLSSVEFEKLIKRLEYYIENYRLSYSAINGYKYYSSRISDTNTNNGLKKFNEEGFYKLREDYNALNCKSVEKAQILLYLLIVYGFNNDLRFSKEGKFNLPVGKTDLNKNNIKKLKDFIERASIKNYDFICQDYNSKEVCKVLEKADFIYMDPPYLIGDAVYNETSKWDNEKECNLLKLIDSFIIEKKKFVLSNVIEKHNMKNQPLSDFVIKNKRNINIIDIDYHYRGASYNKIDRNAGEREIIVVSNY